MSDHIAKFLDAMAAAGCAPESHEIIADDKWRSFQLAGDPKYKKAGYYRLRCDGDWAVGNFGNRREGVTHNWHSKSDRKWSDEEKQAWKDRIEADKIQRQKELEQQYAALAAEAKTRWESATAAHEHPYLEAKGVTVAGLRVTDNELLVPMWRDGKLSNLQSITEDGDKLYMKGPRASGAYFPITAPGDDKSVLLIGEGLATCASIRAATGLPVIVAFDAGGLEPVAKAIRDKYPQAKIVVCADNDAFTVNTKGEAMNTGIIKGQQAAKAVGGFCIWPEFTDNDTAKLTDFNDSHKSIGLDYVRERIMQVATAPVHAEEPPPDSMGELIEYDEMVYEDGDLDLTGDLGLPFRILGHDEGVYYYFPFGKQQIVSMTPSAHTMNNLLQLASLNQWEAFAGAGRVPHSQIATLACNAMINIAHQRGVFSEAARVRGCGAWMDAGRVVLHCGDRVFIDGIQTPFKNISSHYIYIARPRLLSPSEEASTNTEARALRDICEMPTWENKLSGSLLAGWLVIAPVCAMLKHRPHIWITGESGAGKSTLVDIVHRVLGPIALNIGGGGTEAGIREQMGSDGRPLIYDEAEAESQAQKTIMKAVMSLTRQASTGLIVPKYGQKPFNARFAACFSSINPSVSDSADQRRFSMLVLKKNRSPNAREEYATMVAKIKDTITDGFSNRMLARSLKYMPQLLENVNIFTKAAANILKDAGAGDQIGPMLAGLYMLGRTDIVPVERAEEFIRSHNWEFHTNIGEDSDPIKLVHYIATSIVRFTGDTGAARDTTIGELIVAALGKDDRINKEPANRALRQFSIAVGDNGVKIGNRNHNLERVLKETAWSVNWHRTLSDVPGAEKKKGIYFAPGDNQNGVQIPISLFYEGYIQPEFKQYQNEEEIAF